MDSPIALCVQCRAEAVGRYELGARQSEQMGRTSDMYLDETESSALLTQNRDVHATPRASRRLLESRLRKSKADACLEAVGRMWTRCLRTRLDDDALMVDRWSLYISLARRLLSSSRLVCGLLPL
jgi:hypothetical protein